MKSKSIAQELEKDYNQLQQEEMKQIFKNLLIQSKGSIKAKNEMFFPSKKKRRRGGGYGGIGRRYGLNSIEPWQKNLPSASFQIQGNLGSRRNRRS